MEKERAATFALDGLKRGDTEGVGWQCLVARRLAERGVRFIELIDGSSSKNWDQHGDMAEHAKHARNIDQPIAGLVRDLKRRGMLEDTLVVWTTEFGRTPGVDGTKGRGHHSACFSSWLAGPDDGKVTVSSTHLANESAHITVPHSHTWLMWRRSVLTEVRAFLSTGRFSTNHG